MSAASRRSPTGTLAAKFLAVLLLVPTAAPFAQGLGSIPPTETHHSGPEARRPPLDPIISTRKTRNVYVAEGYIDVESELGSVSKALTDLGGYRSWLLQGLDGKDPISSKYIGLFTGLRWNGADLLEIVYDVALPWPLGSKDNVARFVAKADRSKESMDFVSEASTIAYDRIELRFEAARLGEKWTRIGFTFEMQSAWYLVPFVSLKAFADGTGSRVIRIMRNLAEFLPSSVAP
jgi:hypothetical protein